VNARDKPAHDESWGTGATMTMTANPRWSMLASGDFWKLWSVGLILFTVRWIEMLAIAVFVYERTGSPLIVAILTMLRLLPMALCGAFFGEIADRIERRATLVGVCICLFATATVLAALAWSGALEVWHLALATFVNGITWATDNPVRRILLGEVVGADQIGRAMSIDIGTNNACRMIGPAIGGAVLAGVGIHGVFSISVASYAVAALTALAIGHRTVVRTDAAGRFLANIAEGLAIVRRDRRIVGALIVTVIFNVFGWPFTSMVPVIGQDDLLLNPRGIGILASMDGFGAFAGALAIAVWARQASYQKLYVGGTLLYLTLLPVFALLHQPLAAGFALFLTGVTGAAFMTMQSTLIYMLAPHEARSRVFGVLAVCIGLGPIGFIHIGLLASWFGAGAATATIGLEGLVISALTLPLWRPLLRLGQ
jgi:MFS family permease